MAVNEGRSLNEERPERDYPVESIHSFFLDVERGLGRFRTASLIGVIAWVLVLLVLIRFAVHLAEMSEFTGVFPPIGLAFDTVLFALATPSLCYSAYILYAQHRFFQRWSRRFELLDQLEQKLLEEKKDHA
jgi:hypothetical protein